MRCFVRVRFRPYLLRSLRSLRGSASRLASLVGSDAGLFDFGRFAPCAALPPASLRSLGATPVFLASLPLVAARLCLPPRFARWERRRSFWLRSRWSLRGSASRLASLVGSAALRCFVRGWVVVRFRPYLLRSLRSLRGSASRLASLVGSDALRWPYLLRSLRSLRGSASRLASLVGSDAGLFDFGRFAPCAALPPASLRSLGAPAGLFDFGRFAPCAALPPASLRSLGAPPVFLTSVASLPARLCLPPRFARWERRLAVLCFGAGWWFVFDLIYFGRLAPCAALPPASLRSLGAPPCGGLFDFGRFAPCAALPPASLRSLGATPCGALFRGWVVVRFRPYLLRSLSSLRGSASRLASLVGSDALRWPF